MSGGVSTETATTVSGRTISLMDMERTLGVVEISMKDSGKHASEMDKDLTRLTTEICMSETMCGVELRVLVSTSGAVGTRIAASSKTGRRAVWVTGAKANWTTATNIRECISKT